jgi:hypothetical protein
LPPVKANSWTGPPGVARLPLSSLSGAGYAREGARDPLDPLDLYLDGALLQLEPSFAGVGGEAAVGLGASTMVPAAAYAEAARLRDEARQQALLHNEEVLRRLAYLEEQVSNASEKLEKPSAVASAPGAEPTALLESPAPAAAAEDDEYFDALLDEFLSRGADLRGS